MNKFLFIFAYSYNKTSPPTVTLTVSLELHGVPSTVTVAVQTYVRAPARVSVTSDPVVTCPVSRSVHLNEAAGYPSEVHSNVSPTLRSPLGTTISTVVGQSVNIICVIHLHVNELSVNMMYDSIACKWTVCKHDVIHLHVN